MRHALLVLVLLLSALAPPAAATSHLHLEMDVRDATGDARAFPDVRLPQTDIARFTMTTEGDEVVQTVQVVGPWPDNNYWVEVRNSFGGSEALTLKVERTNSSGGNPQPTDYNSSLVQTLDPARMGTRVSFQFERTATTLTFRWPVSAIPPAAQCVTPAVTTLSRTLVDGRSTQVDDKLEVTPDLCQDALPDGLTGTCPAPRANVVAAGTLADDRGDVGERQGLGFAPHDNATLDILSLDTRLDDGWVVQTVLLAEPSPRDRILLTVENQFTANRSSFESGAKATITLLDTGASGVVVDGDAMRGFHVRAERAEPAGWELRWCASVLPASATCFAPVARASLQNGQYSDSVRPAQEQCRATGATPTRGNAPASDGAGAPADDADADVDEEEGGANETPGVGLLGLVAVCFAALVLRRRA